MSTAHGKSGAHGGGGGGGGSGGGPGSTHAFSAMTAEGGSSSTSTNKNGHHTAQIPDEVASHMLRQFEQETMTGYHPPGIPQNNNITGMPLVAMSSVMGGTSIINNNINNNSTVHNGKNVQWVYNPGDGSILQDPQGQPISVDRLLATKPLKDELSSRKGPGGKLLTYLSGDGVSRTLNDIFGFDGWNLDIKKVEQAGKNYDKAKERFEVIYVAHVRVTNTRSGTYREDVGSGDSMDKSYATAVGHAIKASITDALKRAARHFGDKLGGALYGGNLTKKNAPVTLKDALDKYEIERANAKFGFPKDQRNAAAIVASAAASAASAIQAKQEVGQQQQQQRQQQTNDSATTNRGHHHHQNNKAAVQHQNHSHHAAQNQTSRIYNGGNSNGNPQTSSALTDKTTSTAGAPGVQPRNGYAQRQQQQTQQQLQQQQQQCPHAVTTIVPTMTPAPVSYCFNNNNNNNNSGATNGTTNQRLAAPLPSKDSAAGSVLGQQSLQQPNDSQISTTAAVARPPSRYSPKENYSTQNNVSGNNPGNLTNGSLPPVRPSVASVANFPSQPQAQKEQQNPFLKPAPLSAPTQQQPHRGLPLNNLPPQPSNLPASAMATAALQNRNNFGGGVGSNSMTTTSAVKRPAPSNINNPYQSQPKAGRQSL